MMSANEAQASQKPQAVLYARVSSKEQAEGYSVPAQLDLLNGYAKKHGYKILRQLSLARALRQKRGHRAPEEVAPRV